MKKNSFCYVTFDEIPDGSGLHHFSLLAIFLFVFVQLVQQGGCFADSIIVANFACFNL